MKINKFNEAIVDWETDNIKDFYKDVLSIVDSNKSISLSELKEIGEKHDIEIVDYDTFLSDLPDEQMKKDAPPKGAIPVFGLVNPVTHKAIIVVQVPGLDKGLLNMAYHMLKHENVHVGQKSRKKDKSKGEYLGDIRDLKSYFSNKDEVMAFSQSIVDMIMDRSPKSFEEAKKELKYNRLWSDIKRNVDDKIKKRYIKYIYLYLEKEFDKKGIEDKRKPNFSKKEEKCEYCGGVGYHKMSCPRTKMVVNITDSETKPDSSSVSKRVDDLLSKASKGILKFDEYNKVIDSLIDDVLNLDAAEKETLGRKLKYIHSRVEK